MSFLSIIAWLSLIMTLVTGTRKSENQAMQVISLLDYNPTAKIDPPIYVDIPAYVEFTVKEIEVTIANTFVTVSHEDGERRMVTMYASCLTKDAKSLCRVLFVPQNTPSDGRKCKIVVSFDLQRPGNMFNWSFVGCGFLLKCIDQFGDIR